MDTTRKPNPAPPTPPEDCACCGSECGDACIHEIYRREKAEYDAQQNAEKEKVLQE